MLKLKLPKQEQGFTLIEVLVAILIATIFITVTMQMMVIAAIFKVRAQEYAEATTWIQEDLEDVKYQAANYKYTLLKVDAISTGKVLQVSSVNNFADDDKLLVGTDSTNNIIESIDNTKNPLEITLKANLDTNWLIDTPVVAITRCNAVLPDVGFADGLRDEITGSDKNTTRNDKYFDKTSKVFTGKTFRLKRTTTISGDSPFNTLRISYDVSPISSIGGSISGSSVAQFDTEVIPNAALQCPN